MKKKLLFILGIIIIVTITFFLFEQGASYYANRSSKKYTIAEISYSNYANNKEYHGYLINNDGTINEFKNTTENIISQTWYRIMYHDLIKLKKYINDLEGNFEITKSVRANSGSTSIYVYRRGGKVIIYETGYREGLNDSKEAQRIIKIIKKYIKKID